VFQYTNLVDQPAAQARRKLSRFDRRDRHWSGGVRAAPIVGLEAGVSLCVLDSSCIVEAAADRPGGAATLRRPARRGGCSRRQKPLPNGSAPKRRRSVGRLVEHLLGGCACRPRLLPSPPSRLRRESPDARASSDDRRAAGRPSSATAGPLRAFSSSVSLSASTARTATPGIRLGRQREAETPRRRNLTRGRGRARRRTLPFRSWTCSPWPGRTDPAPRSGAGRTLAEGYRTGPTIAPTAIDRRIAATSVASA